MAIGLFYFGANIVALTANLLTGAGVLISRRRRSSSTFGASGATPAVVVLTKTSPVFVLHRETGEPLFPIEERAVPGSDVPGERASPTQPFAVRPPPLSSHRITEADLYDVTPEHRDECAKRLANLRNDGITLR